MGLWGACPTGRVLGWLQQGQTQQPFGRSSADRQGCARHSVWTARWHWLHTRPGPAGILPR